MGVSLGIPISCSLSRKHEPLGRTGQSSLLSHQFKGTSATGVLTSLPPEQCQDYLSLTAALEIRLRTKHQVELNQMKLQNRIC